MNNPSLGWIPSCRSPHAPTSLSYKHTYPLIPHFFSFCTTSRLFNNYQQKTPATAEKTKRSSCCGRAPRSIFPSQPLPGVCVGLWRWGAALAGPAGRALPGRAGGAALAVVLNAAPARTGAPLGSLPALMSPGTAIGTDLPPWNEETKFCL